MKSKVVISVCVSLLVSIFGITSSNADVLGNNKSTYETSSPLMDFINRVTYTIYKVDDHREITRLGNGAIFRKDNQSESGMSIYDKKGSFVAYLDIPSNSNVKMISSNEVIVFDETISSGMFEERGFCLFGKNPNGSCRGASTVRKVTGFLKRNKNCIAGTAGGAGTGGLVGGASSGPIGAGVGAISGGLTGFATFCK